MTKGGIGCVIVFALILILGVSLYETCPTPSDHRAALNDVVTAVIDDKFETHRDDLIGKAMDLLGKNNIGQTGQLAVSQMLHVDNYYFFSIGRIHFKGREHTVSFGILGHVFAPDKEYLQEELSRFGL